MVQDLNRLLNWRARFSAEMDRQRRDPFAWGTHDCALGLAAGAVEAITGQDLRGEWGGYTTAKGALLALKRAGYATLGDAVAAVLPEIHPAMARVGDIGLVPADGEIGQGLCVFDSSKLIVMTEQGHGRADRSLAVRAFKVG